MAAKPLALVPAAALTQPDALRPASPDDSIYAQQQTAKAISTFTEAIGGQDQLLADLATSPFITPALQAFLTISFDPRYQGKSFGWRCAKVGLRPGDLFDAFRDARGAKATVIAMTESTDRLQEMLTEIVANAVTHEEPCDTCRGTKVVFSYGTKINKKTGAVTAVETQQRCTACQGHGTVIRRPDKEDQRLILELAGLLKKVNGPLVQTNIQNNLTGGGSVEVVAGSDALVQLQQAVTGILFGRDSVIPPIATRDPDPDVVASPADADAAVVPT